MAARKDRAQQRQPGSIALLKPRTGVLAPKDTQSVAQHQDLDFVGVAGPKGRNTSSILRFDATYTEHRTTHSP